MKLKDKLKEILTSQPGTYFLNEEKNTSKKLVGKNEPSKRNMCKELRSQQKTKIQMVCKHVKRCEASTITVGMQIKTT